MYTPSPLGIAIRAGHLEIVKTLIKAGAFVDEHLSVGCTCRAQVISLIPTYVYIHINEEPCSYQFVLFLL